jgi:hypothetical protein
MAERGKKRDLVVEIRRDYDGRLYSQVVDRIEKKRYESGASRRDMTFPTHTLVVDRQKGKLLDAETVQNRAASLAEVIGCPLEEDLFWPCRAREGLGYCSCPDCANRSDERERRRRGSN